MEALANDLLSEINVLCAKYHYKRIDAIEEGKKIAGNIQQFLQLVLQGIEGNKDEDNIQLQNYILGVLKDYMEAIKQHDSVLMVDTLDYGLRELLNIFKEEDGEQESNG